MKSTGIVRKVDELGRIVIPKELRNIRNIKEGDPVEVFVEGENIILKKFETANECFVTGEVSESNVTLLDGRLTLSKEGAKALAFMLMEVE